jgi:hypothetical protein
MKITLTFLLSISTALASLGNLVDNSEIPQSICLAEFSNSSQTYHCSGAMIDKNTFKTAAHCLDDGYKVEIRCNSGEIFKAKEILGHKDFSKHEIKRDLYARKFDHAYIKIDGEYKGTFTKLLTSKKLIKKVISESNECAFFGVGLNPYYQGTGKLHGVRTKAQMLNPDNGLLILNDPFGALTMIGDSGASFFCKDENDYWNNIGTVSAHSWDNETIIASNASIQGDQTLTHTPESPSLATSNILVNRNVVRVGKTYDVLPFSEYLFEDSKYNLADRLNSRFTTESIKNGKAIGTLEHFGPSLYYLCLDGISCEETLENVTIELSRLVESFETPDFIEL